MKIDARKRTKDIKIGNIHIGGINPITIQSMTNTKTSDVMATVSQIRSLEQAGCDIVRVSVPDQASADAIRDIKKNITIPLVADIHFNSALAIKSIENGADKIRINPGNIGGREKVREVVKAASARGIPVRIGINCGSLEKDIIARHGHPSADAVMESVDRNVGMIEEFGFSDIVISVKASDILLNYEANCRISDKYSYPLHIGVTESGSGLQGVIKSAAGISMLLKDGIGDTIRVSLTGDPVQEVYAAKEILSCLNIKKSGVEIISCPTCARTETDILGVIEELRELTKDITRHIKVAVMGCAVNGPGEAKEADIGIAGGRNEFLLFVKGAAVKKISREKAALELDSYIRSMLRDG